MPYLEVLPWLRDMKTIDILSINVQSKHNFMNVFLYIITFLSFFANMQNQIVIDRCELISGEM